MASHSSMLLRPWIDRKMVTEMRVEYRVGSNYKHKVKQNLDSIRRIFRALRSILSTNTTQTKMAIR